MSRQKQHIFMNWKSPRAAWSPVSCCPRGLASRTEEEEVMEGRAPGAADTQSSATFHPLGAHRKELSESGSWAICGNTLPLPPSFRIELSQLRFIKLFVFSLSWLGHSCLSKGEVTRCVVFCNPPGQAEFRKVQHPSQP